MRGRRTSLLAVAAVVGPLLIGTAPARADDEPETRWIVTFAPGADARIDGEDDVVTIGSLDLAVAATAAEAAALEARPDVVAVEPDGPAFAAVVPNDPCFLGPGCPLGASQVGLRRIHAATAWDVTTGSAAPNEVVVAVIDTGVDPWAPELGARVTLVPPGPGGCAGLVADYAPEGGDGIPELGTVDQSSISHGTRVAGIIGAAGNSVGVSGVVPGPLRIRSYQALRADRGGRTSDVAAAVNCAVDDGADVINLSLTAQDQPALRNAIVRAANAGIVIVAAAGNGSNPNHPGDFPASYPEVIGVAATNALDARASFSNGGGWIDLAAPGTNVLSTVRVSAGSYSADQSGTSFSTPFVSGAAALVLARAPGAPAALVRAQLEATAEPLADPTLGRGLVDLSAAVHFPVAGSPACSAGAGYVLDGYGGTHPVGGAPVLAGGPYWPGWDIARDLATAADRPGGYLLDGFGGVHPLGGAPGLTRGAYWPGWNIARAIARRPDGLGVYKLDGFGGVHLTPAVGAAPTRGPGGPYWPGWDIARDLAVDPTDSTRGFVLDGYGGVHAFGFGPTIQVSNYTPGRDLARRLVVLPDGSGGYVLDVAGRLHPFAVGAAPLPAPAATATFGIGPARGIDIGTGGMAVVSGFGSTVPAGTVPCLLAPRWPGWDISRAYAAAP